MTDAINDAFQCLCDVDVPKSQNLVALGIERFCSMRIILNCLTMLATVQFDNNFWIVTRKISDISGKPDLATEMSSFGFEQPQLLP